MKFFHRLLLIPLQQQPIVKKILHPPSPVLAQTLLHSRIHSPLLFSFHHLECQIIGLKHCNRISVHRTLENLGGYLKDAAALCCDYSKPKGEISYGHMPMIYYL